MPERRAVSGPERNVRSGDTSRTWSAQPNDLIGGWIVTNLPIPMSEIDTRSWPKFDPAKRAYVIAECFSHADAAVIADVLNEAGIKREAPL